MSTLQNNNYSIIGDIKAKYSKRIRVAMLQIIANSEY